MVTGKDGNPLNEVELMSDSLTNNDGVLRGNNVLKLIPGQSVVKLNIATGSGSTRRSSNISPGRSSPKSNPSFVRSAAHQSPSCSSSNHGELRESYWYGPTAGRTR
jgi:hypothetical protein